MMLVRRVGREGKNRRAAPECALVRMELRVVQREVRRAFKLDAEETERAGQLRAEVREVLATHRDEFVRDVGIADDCARRA